MIELLRRVRSSPVDGLGAKRIDDPGRDVDEGIWHVIKNRRRRLAILYVDEHGPVTFSDLAESVADADHDQWGASERSAEYVSYLQQHGPVLDEAGILDYDERVKAFHPTDVTPHVAEFIRDGYRLFGDDPGAEELLS